MIRPAPGERLVWLVTVEWAGRTWRFASETITVDDDGDKRTYLAGVAGLRVRREAEPLSVSPAPASASVELVWPESVAALVALGHDLSAATAEVALHRVGLDLSWREVYVSGRVVEPEYDEILNPDGSRHSIVALTVEEAPWDDRALHPGPEAVVSAATWPDHFDGDAGRAYPTVWGQPGVYRDASGAELTAPGSPALIVEYSALGSTADKLLIAGHRVSAATVLLYYADSTAFDGWSTTTVTVTHEADGLGRVCAVVELPALAAVTGAGAYWIAWPDGAGLLSEIDGAPLTRMGHLVEWWLTRSTGRVDRARLAAVRPLLDRWRTSGYCDEQVSPWDYVADNLLPLLPVSVASGAGGLYLLPWRWDAGVEDAQVTLTEAPGRPHVGRVAYQQPPWERCNQRTIRWALDANTNEYLRSTTLGPSPDPDDPDAIDSLIVEASASRLGVMPGDDVTTDVLTDRDSAALTLLWRAARDAASRRRVTLDLLQSYAYVQPGWVARVVSDHLLIDAVADVVAVEIDDHARVLIEVEIRPAAPTTGSIVPLDDDPREPPQ